MTPSVSGSVQPSSVLSVSASRIFTADVTGRWEGYTTFQDSSGVWRDSTSVFFDVVSASIVPSGSTSGSSGSVDPIPSGSTGQVTGSTPSVTSSIVVTVSGDYKTGLVDGWKLGYIQGVADAKAGKV